MLNKERVFVSARESLRPNEIPSITVYGENLPEAWENAVLAVAEFGASIKTQYDQEIDPESKDASMFLTVIDPLAEPRIHKALPCGLDELWIYTQEIVKGVRDYRVSQGGSYSYHDRLTNWPGVDGWDWFKTDKEELILPHLDQLGRMIETLSEVPYTRRAQAITWNPPRDSFHHEPPCLQRIWGRMVKSGDVYLLEMNTHWRSRDALKAAFMNMFGLTELQRWMAQQISEKLGQPVVPGRYTEMVDSYHNYGSYERRGEIAGFLRSLQKRSFAERTYRSDDPVVMEQFEEGRKRLERELAERGNQ